jgi:hypothetical protein
MWMIGILSAKSSPISIFILLVSPKTSLSGDFSRASPLFSIFIGKNVAVDVDGQLTVEGRLIHYSESGAGKNHVPSILIVENSQGRHIIRGKFRMIRRLVQ